MRYYLNWQTIPLFVALIMAGFFIPHTKPAAGIMMISLLIVAIVPVIYAYYNARKIKSDKGRRSLVKGYVITSSAVLLWTNNLIFNGIAVVGREWKKASFLNPTHYYPIVFTVMIAFFIVYGLSCIRLCRQEFKIAD